MSEQKNKLIIVITIAIVSVLLLGGVSFTFFPSQTKPTSTPQLTISANSIDQAFVPTANSSFQIVGDHSINSSLSSSNVSSVGGLAYWVTPSTNPHILWVATTITPVDYVIIGNDESVNSTAPIKRSGNVYTLTGDIINQTILVQRNNVVIDGAGHSLVGYNRDYSYALENIHLENLTGVTVKNLNVSSSWQGIWIQNCTGITIQNCTLSKINTGVDAVSSSKCKIVGNSFVNLTTAISFTPLWGFDESANNVVSENNVSSVATGITFCNAYSNSVTNNIIVNAYDSIYADINATVARNTLIGGIDGISVNSNSQIYDNTVSNFSESGILLSGVNSLIFGNTVQNCFSAVAMIGSSDGYPFGNNTMWHNNFVNNTQPLSLYTNSSLSLNQWDNRGAGNYWSSYNGTDLNKDGIGDTQFQIGANNTDLFPLMQPYVATVNSYDHGAAQLFFTLAGVAAAGGVFVALTWAYFGKRTIKKKLPIAKERIP